MFFGAAVLAVALAGGATMLGLDLYESHASMEVVANSSQATPVQPAQSGTLPFVEKRPSSVPPLVLVPPDPNAKKAAAPVAAQAEVKEEVAAAAPTPAQKPVIAPVPATTKAVPAKPLAAAIAVQPPAAAPVAPKPVAKAKLAAKKPATAAKRAAKPVLAKARTDRPIKGTMLQPPRDRSDEQARDDDRPAPRQAIDRRCRPGELARECEARTR